MKGEGNKRALALSVPTDIGANIEPGVDEKLDAIDALPVQTGPLF